MATEFFLGIACLSQAQNEITTSGHYDKNPKSHLTHPGDQFSSNRCLPPARRRSEIRNPKSKIQNSLSGASDAAFLGIARPQGPHSQGTGSEIVSLAPAAASA